MIDGFIFPSLTFLNREGGISKIENSFIILLKPSVIAFRHTLILSFRIILVNGVIDLWKKHDLLVLL